MPHFNDEESYYDILKVNRKSTTGEIVTAYHTAKSAFSKDSVATYSLFSPEEAKVILQKLEEAYQNLCNLDRRKQYDQWLDSNSKVPAAPVTAVWDAPQKNAEVEVALPPPPVATPTKPLPLPKNDVPIILKAEDVLNGSRLRNIRETRGYSREEVSSTIRISLRYLDAIEQENFRNLPARVYLQGFLKNLASLYRIDPVLTTKLYLSYLDKRLVDTQGF